METIFPDADGVTGAFLTGARRRPGSPPGPASIEQVMTVVLKRAYTVAAAPDPGNGALVPDPSGPGIFETDSPASILVNGDFSDGLSGWTATGGAQPTAVDGGVALGRSGGPGDLRRTAVLGRQLRGRTVRLVVGATAATGRIPVSPVLDAGVGAVSAGGDGPAEFPDGEPALLSTRLECPEDLTATGVSAELATLDADGDTVTYTGAVVTTLDHESDLVADKPHCDLVVIADSPPEPVTVAVDDTVRMSQSGITPTLTGLGWEPRTSDARRAEGGDFAAPLTQELPDDFSTSYYNGYRRAAATAATGPVGHLAPGAAIAIRRSGVADAYAFTLPATFPTLRHEWHVGPGADDPRLWHRRDVPMALDTLVVEPDRDMAYAVWRAVWPVDLVVGTGPIPSDAHRRLTVTLEGT